MTSTLATSFLHLKSLSSSSPPPPQPPHFFPARHRCPPSLPSLKFKIVNATSNRAAPTAPAHSPHPFLPSLKILTKATILIATTASIAARFSLFPPPPPARAETTLTQQETPIADEQEEEEREAEVAPEKSPNDPSLSPSPSSSPLSELLENEEAVESLKSLLQQKLEGGEDEEALKILNSLVSAQPSATEWKFLKARLLSELGEAQDARKVFEEILTENPLSFEALFENAILMDRCGEGEAVIRRLEEALAVAEEENKAKEARDVRLIMAQIQFLQKNVEEALKSYRELSKEDPKDFRPYFCQGMIYSLLDRNEEAREQFAKYRELSPKKFEVEGYLRTSLSRMKLFGTNEEN